jgi:hypothetical protein
MARQDDVPHVAARPASQKRRSRPHRRRNNSLIRPPWLWGRDLCLQLAEDREIRHYLSGRDRTTGSSLRVRNGAECMRAFP